MQNFAQLHALLRPRQTLSKKNAVDFAPRQNTAKILQFHGSRNLRRRRPPRLLRCLTNNPQPAFAALRGGHSQMRVAPAGDDGNNASDSNLRALLDRPLHAVELEDSQRQRDRGSGPRLGPVMVLLLAERELNPIVGDRGNGSAPNFIPGCDVELLPDFSAQHAAKMSRMFAHQSSSVSGDFVGDPAAACHESVPGSQFSVPSFKILSVIFCESAFTEN